MFDGALGCPLPDDNKRRVRHFFFSIFDTQVGEDAPARAPVRRQAIGRPFGQLLGLPMDALGHSPTLRSRY